MGKPTRNCSVKRSARAPVSLADDAQIREAHHDCAD